MAMTPGIGAMGPLLKLQVIVLAMVYMSNSVILLMALAMDEINEFDANIILDCLLAIIPAVLMLKYLNRNVRVIILIFTVFQSVTGLIDACADALEIQTEGLAIIIVMIFMDCMLLFSGIHCYLGDRHSASRLFFINLILLVLCIFSLLPTFIVANGPSVSILLISIADILTIVIFMILLVQPGVREELIGRRMKRDLVIVESIMTSSSDVYIYVDDVPTLLGLDRSKWYDCSPDSPYACFGVVRVHDPPKEFLFYSRIWKGENFIRMGVDQDLQTDSYGWSFPLRAHTIEQTPEGPYVRLYGDNGFYMRIRMKERPKNDHDYVILKPDVNERGNLYLDLEEKIIGR